VAVPFQGAKSFENSCNDSTNHFAIHFFMLEKFGCGYGRATLYVNKRYIPCARKTMVKVENETQAGGLLKYNHNLATFLRK
jgi:hypothetical protein